MSGGIPGDGGGGGARDGGRGCQRRESGGFQISGGEGVLDPGHRPPTPRVKMKIDIVTRENKILTHDLNKKNPTIMHVDLEFSHSISKKMQM